MPDSMAPSATVCQICVGLGFFPCAVRPFLGGGALPCYGAVFVLPPATAVGIRLSTAQETTLTWAVHLQRLLTADATEVVPPIFTAITRAPFGERGPLACLAPGGELLSAAGGVALLPPLGQGPIP